MKLALLQDLSCASDLDLALAKADAALRAAAAIGAAMLVLPEVWLPGYNQPDIAAKAVDRTGEVIAQVSKLCRNAGCGMVMGYAEREGSAKYNSAIVVDASGQIVGNYRKLQLYGPREKAIYRAGTEYLVFDLGPVKAAVLICYDIEFATHIAALAAMGVTVILAPTANMQPFTHVVRHTVPAMAANHGISIVYANYCGSEGDLDYVGGSLIAGPHGEVLAQAGSGPALLVAELPPRDPSRLSTQAIDFRKV